MVERCSQFGIGENHEMDGAIGKTFMEYIDDEVGGNRRGIARSSDLDYCQGSKRLNLIIFFCMLFFKVF